VWVAEFADARLRLDQLGVGLVSVDVVPTWAHDFTRTSITLVRRQRPALEMSSAELAAQRAIVGREHTVLQPGAWVDPAEVMCDPQCSTRSPSGLSRYSDGTHLSPHGAAELADLFAERLPGAVAASGG
jgi:hypothetical protein